MTKDAYLNPYRHSVRRHGPTFDATLWASEASQQLRFEVFVQMAELAGRRILDAGCSRGDLAAFLLQQGVAYSHYVGIDALCEVIEFARSRDLPRTTFTCGDFVRQPELLAQARPQVICISGSLNTMDDATAHHVLQQAWQATEETLLFNFLSDKAGPKAPLQDDFARRLDTIRLLEWAFSQTWAVTFCQDYFPNGHDATIMMRKT